MRRVLATAVAVVLPAMLGIVPAFADVVTSPNPVLRWNLDEGSGTTTADTSGHGNTGTLSASSMWTTSTSHSGGVAASFVRANSQSIVTSSSVINTSQSFTMSAWVYMTSTAGTEGILGQAGTTSTGAFLKYNLGQNGWSFLMPESDVNGPVQDEAVAAGSASLNTWTWLVGVYNATSGVMSLYVNGAIQVATVHTTTWNATGSVIVGRLHWAGVDQNYFDGAIDDVQIWNQALSGTDIGDLYNSTTTAGPTLRWDFDAGSGTTAYDRSGSNNYGTLSTSTSFWTTTAHSAGEALNFNGTSTYYVTSRAPAVHTNQSFSVSAWVRLAATGSTAVVASQFGTTSSAFILKYEPAGAVNGWDFLMARSDASSPGIDEAYSTGSASTGVWTQLVGVFDASAGVSSLYINGSAAGSHTHTSTWDATGAVNVGRAWWNGATGLYFNGQIDDVRIYQRALTTTEIGELYHDVTPGVSNELYLATQSFSFGSKALTGANANITATPGSPWTVIDSRGTGAAWSATISATALTSAAGSVETTARTIAVNKMSMSNGTITVGSLSDPTTNLTSSNVTLSTSSQAFLSSSGTNRGTYTFTPTLTIAVPANAYRSNYSGAVNGSAQNPYTATITVTIS